MRPRLRAIAQNAIFLKCTKENPGRATSLKADLSANLILDTTDNKQILKQPVSDTFVLWLKPCIRSIWSMAHTVGVTRR